MKLRATADLQKDYFHGISVLAGLMTFMKIQHHVGLWLMQPVLIMGVRIRLILALNV
jgi:hypothetical protein